MGRIDPGLEEEWEDIIEAVDEKDLDLSEEDVAEEVQAAREKHRRDAGSD